MNQTGWWYRNGSTGWRHNSSSVREPGTWMDEIRPHQNWGQRETLTTDGPGEYGHGWIMRASGKNVTVVWTWLERAPVRGASFIIVAGGGLGQRRFLSGVDGASPICSPPRTSSNSSAGDLRGPASTILVSLASGLHSSPRCSCGQGAP